MRIRICAIGCVLACLAGHAAVIDFTQAEGYVDGDLIDHSDWKGFSSFQVDASKGVLTEFEAFHRSFLTTAVPKETRTVQVGAGFTFKQVSPQPATDEAFFGVELLNDCRKNADSVRVELARQKWSDDAYQLRFACNAGKGTFLRFPWIQAKKLGIDSGSKDFTSDLLDLSVQFTHGEDEAKWTAWVVLSNKTAGVAVQSSPVSFETDRGFFESNLYGSLNPCSSKANVEAREIQYFYIQSDGLNQEASVSSSVTAQTSPVAVGSEASVNGGLRDRLTTNDQVAKFTAFRQSVADDLYRPLYHFSSPGGFLNDPNGLCQWNGNYHLFYQLKPEGETSMHWGHAVSADLIHWEDLPIALVPTTEKECFSGQTVVESDRVIAMYFGTESGEAVATASDPMLLNWQKHPDNPVIPIPPDGAEYRLFDPCIWKEGSEYFCLSGTRSDKGNAAYLFRSEDLGTWDYIGPFYEDGKWTDMGEDGAVPNFWPIGEGKHMLLFFSHLRSAQYYIGSYNQDQRKFYPQVHGRMNYGPPLHGSLHAPSATIDDQGRLVAIFNVKTGRTDAPWTGMMTLPRILSLHKQLNWLESWLDIRPADEVEALRFNHMKAESLLIPANTEIPVSGVEGKSMELAVTLDPKQSRAVGLKVFRSPDGREETAITLYTVGGRKKNQRELSIDVTRASLGSNVFARSPEIGPLTMEDGELLNLRVFIDRSIVEVFANGRQCLTLRAYPTMEDSNGVSVFSLGNDAELVSLDAWHMRSIWPELACLEGK